MTCLHDISDHLNIDREHQSQWQALQDHGVATIELLELLSLLLSWKLQVCCTQSLLPQRMKTKRTVLKQLKVMRMDQRLENTSYHFIWRENAWKESGKSCVGRDGQEFVPQTKFWCLISTVSCLLHSSTTLLFALAQEVSPAMVWNRSSLKGWPYSHLETVSSSLQRCVRNTTKFE